MGRALTCLVCLWLAATALAQTDDRLGETRPRIALVLSGGGARGFAHVGVLEILEKLRVPVDCVVGTSMGALVGGTYATGVSPGLIRDKLESTDIAALFVDDPPRSEIPERVKRDDFKPLFDITLGFNHGSIQFPQGASAGYKVELFLKDIIGPTASLENLDFNTLPTPYRAVATDLETGKMQVFDHGDLAKIMRASMSLPAIVAPIQIDGRPYVDGGLVRNLPVDVGRSLCGGIVIAVNLGTPLKRLDELSSVIGVAGQSMNLLTEQNVQRSLEELREGDVLIEPDLEGFSSADFNKVKDIIERGVAAAESRSGPLSALSLDEQDYVLWMQQRDSRRLPPPRITRIKVLKNDRFGADVIERDIDVEPGDDFDYRKLHQDLIRLYGRADFSYLGYSIAPGADGSTIEVDAQAKPWGPGYIKLGVSAITDFSSPTQANVAVSYRRTWANRLGAEWRADAQLGYDSFFAAEFLQPLQIRDGAFVAPSIEIRRTFTQLYDKEIRLGQIRENTQRIGLDFGLTGSLGEVRLGPYGENLQEDPELGAITVLVPREELTLIGLKFSGVVDQLDHVSFATKGWLAAFNLRSSKESWNSDADYTRGEVILHGVQTFGKNTVGLRLEWGDDLGGDLPVSELFQLGGPGRLSGLFLDQLTGYRYNLGVLNFYHRYSVLPSQLGRGMYVGFTAEAGRIDDPLMENPWDWVSSGSIYWGADTVVGSVYLGYGYSSLGQGAAYLMIGPQF
jgi:NTE family protein